MQSKFCNIDDWETVDLTATGATMEMGMADPASSIGFSIFMSAEAGTPVSKDMSDDAPANTSGSALASSPPPGGKSAGRTKSNEGRNIFIGMEPPKPSWVRENY